MPCLDADALAHGSDGGRHRSDGGDRRPLRIDVLAADGSVDRAKLGPIVFADPSARRDLEAIVHPAVYRAIAAGFRAFELIGGARLPSSMCRCCSKPDAMRDFDRSS